MDAGNIRVERRRTVIFILIGLIFVGLVFLLLWFMKQRDDTYAKQESQQTVATTPEKQNGNQPSSGQNNTQNQNGNGGNAPSTQTPNSSNEQPAGGNGSNGTSTEGQTHVPAQTAPQAELPATGPTGNILVLMSVVVLGYTITRYVRSRDISLQS